MKALARRLQRVEQATGIADGPLPTIFVFVTDAGRPDPDAPAQEIDYSEQAISGAYTSRGDKRQVIERKPGEGLEAFQSRLSNTLPDERLFFMRYLHEMDSAASATAH